MDSIIEEQFPWIPIVKRGFLKSFNGDYEIGILDLLQQNIDEEIQKVQHKFNFKRARLLFECIDNFYVHFCRKWNHCNKFSSCMEVACVHILSSFIKISLLLSRGNKFSNWIYQVVTKIMRFPGEKNVIYDALLSVHCLNKKYKPAYGAILMHILVNVPLFVPVIINEPTEYLKVYLLVRRLKGLVKDPLEKAQLRMRASKILAPANLTNWLLAHDFSAAHTKTASQRINLGINICKKLAGEKSELEVVETLRKILLPGICIESKAKDGEMKITSCKTGAKNKKIKRRRNFGSLMRDDPILSKEAEENINAGIPGLQKRSRKTKGSVGSVEKIFDTTDHTLPLGSLDNGELVRPEKNRKGQKSIHLEENLQNETGQSDVPLQVCTFESVKRVSKRNKKQKLVHETSQGFDEDSCLQMDNMEDVKQNADRRKQLESENLKEEKEKDFVVNDKSAAKSKKKRKQKEEMLSAIAKHPIIGNDSSGNNSLLTVDPQTAEITKSKRKRQKTNELDSNLKDIQSDAEDLPVIIVDEINAADSDEPVIVTEVKHYLKFDASSSRDNRNKPKKSDLNLNTTPDATIVAEEEFFIDSKPSPCHSESGSVQIMYDVINDVEQKNVSLSDKPKTPINNDKKLNSSVDLKDGILPVESSSRAKIAEKIHTLEETLESCTGSSNSLNSDHQTTISVSNLASGCLVSEKEASISLGTHTDDQEGKNEDQDNVIDSNVEEHSSLINGTDEESSRDSAVQTESRDYSSNVVESCINCKNIKSSLTSESPPQTEFIKGTSQENTTSQETNPVVESLDASLNSNNSPKIEMQKDDHASVETGEFASDNSHSSLKSNTCAQEPDVQKDDNASIETGEFVSDNSHSSLKSNTCAQEPDVQKDDNASIETGEFVSDNSHSSLKSNTCAQEPDVQKDDNASIETGEFVSDNSHSSLKSNTCAQEPDVQKDDHASIETDEILPGTSHSSLLENNDCALEAELQKSYQIQTDKLVSRNDHSSSKSIDGAQEAEVQKDDPASIEIDVLVSGTSHSPLKSNTCAQEPKMQKDDFAPVQNDKLVSGNNKVDIPEENLSNTEITENNSIIVTSELPIQNSPVSCLSQKEKVTQENKAPETSSISSPTSNISQSLSETTSESVNIDSSENENLEMQEKNGSVAKKSEAPLENSIPSILESKTSQQPIDNLLNTGSSSQETKIREQKLISNNSSPNKIHPEVVSNSDSSCSSEIDCSDVIEDKSNIDIRSPSKRDSIHDLQVKQVTGLFIGAKSPVLVDLPEDSLRSVNDKVMDKNQPMKQNQDDKTENNVLKTPNSSAAKGLMDNMLKLVEIAGDTNDESTRKNILKGNFTSTLHTLSLKFLSSAASSSPDKKAAKCLSFLDISSESDHENIGCLTPECSKFLQYREFLNDLDDNRSEDTLSENKSISKTDASEYHSDASHDIESEDSDCDSPMVSSDAVPEESSSKNSIERSQLSEKENGESGLSLQDDDSDISAKNKLLKVLQLNPVVNLGEKCDSMNFVDPLSSTSELLSTTSSTAKPSSVVDEKLKDKMPSGSSPATSTVNPFDEITVKQNVIKDLPSNSGEEKNGEESNTAEMEIQLEHKDVKELSLTTDHELAASDKVCESVEHTNEKDLSQDQENNAGRVLRKRPSATVESQKSVPVHEDSSVTQQNTPASCRRSLRCRNPPASSSREVGKSKSSILASGAKRSSRRFRKEVNLNLGFDFSTLSLDSPKSVKNKPNISLNDSSSEVLKEDNESPTSDQVNPCRRLTRASMNISSNVDSEIKDQEIDPEGYNLRSRKSVIMPGKLKL